jgi:hypothetical protein
MILPGVYVRPYEKKPRSALLVFKTRGDGIVEHIDTSGDNSNICVAKEGESVLENFSEEYRLATEEEISFLKSYLELQRGFLKTKINMIEGIVQGIPKCKQKSKERYPGDGDPIMVQMADAFGSGWDGREY